MLRKIHLQEEERRLEILAKMSASNKESDEFVEKSTAVLEAIKERSYRRVQSFRYGAERIDQEEERGNRVEKCGIDSDGKKSSQCTCLH